MKDVATYSRWKPALGAAPRLLFGVVGLTAAFVLGRFMGAPLYICLLPTTIGFLFFSAGVRRLFAAFEKDCWLRAGPEGIAWRLPGRARAKTLWCAYDMDERSIGWKDVQGLQLVEHRINGIPTGTDLAIVATNGWRKRLDRAYFQESAAHIRAAIAQAAGR